MDPMLVPVVVANPRKLTFQKWFELYGDKVDELFNRLLNKLKDAKFPEGYVITIDENNLYQDLAAHMYKTSYNTDKHFM